MTTIRLLIIHLIAASLFAACGGAPPPETKISDDGDIDDESRYSADDFISRPELRTVELTTEVDEQRYRATGPVTDQFSAATPLIFLVGKLHKVPTHATIEVHWFKESLSEPMLVSEVLGSETFSFVSSFRPTDRRFIPGAYNVRIIVNGTDIGGTSFTILGKDPLAGGVQITKLKISTKINGKQMSPVSPSKKFRAGTRTLYATFAVKNALEATDVTVRWSREGSVFSETLIPVSGTGRFGGDVSSPTGLPNGTYLVEVEMAGNVAAKEFITVGGTSSGPSVDKVALGLALGTDNMPTKERSSFQKGTFSIMCGLRFLDLQPDSRITLEWNMLLGDSESTYHTVQTPVPAGGSGTMASQWAPGEIETGDYRLVVYINDAPVTEKLFSVK